MTFTTSFFLIGILPWFVLACYMLRRYSKVRTLLVLLANCVFYIWGGVGTFLFLAVYTCVIFALSNTINKINSKPYLVLSLAVSIAPLIFVKYAAFFINNINQLIGTRIGCPSVAVPIGISFYSFQAVSLIVDQYRKVITTRPRLVDVFAYLTFFPTVTSGPILRYNLFTEQLNKSPYNVNFNYAIERICCGLIKKVLLADKLAILADYYFDGVALGNEYSWFGLWIGSIAYTLQLYFDFSGYSDMAIGIGELIGFRIGENFNKPYQAKSVSEFWRRWHISLSQWFRDYVYIPLGGNRCSTYRHIFNLFVVWVLTGIWHGADWSFIVWGMGYFLLLVVEKYNPVMKNIGTSWIGRVYTLFFVNLLWIPFRAENLSITFRYIKGMLRLNNAIGIEAIAISYIPYVLVAILCCCSYRRLSVVIAENKCMEFLKSSALLLLLIVAICAMVNAAYTPYIYGNF